MWYDPQRVIDVALNEVGYKEKATNAQLDDPDANPGSRNYTKYARDLAKLPWFNGSKTGVAWCGVFVAWCFVVAYGEDAARALLCQPSAKNNCGAGCKYARNYFKRKGRLMDAPEPGDVIFFWAKDGKSVQHMGLVYAVDDKNVYTVEGNTSGGSGVDANGAGSPGGGMVCRKSYRLDYGRIAGYGRPDWGNKSDSPLKSVTLTLPYDTAQMLFAALGHVISAS